MGSGVSIPDGDVTKGQAKALAGDRWASIEAEFDHASSDGTVSAEQFREYIMTHGVGAPTAHTPGHSKNVSLRQYMSTIKAFGRFNSAGGAADEKKDGKERTAPDATGDMSDPTVKNMMRVGTPHQFAIAPACCG